MLEELDLDLFLVFQDGVPTLLHFPEPLLLDHLTLHLGLEGLLGIFFGLLVSANLENILALTLLFHSFLVLSHLPIKGLVVFADSKLHAFFLLFLLFDMLLKLLVLLPLENIQSLAVPLLHFHQPLLLLHSLLLTNHLFSMLFLHLLFHCLHVPLVQLPSLLCLFFHFPLHFLLLPLELGLGQLPVELELQSLLLPLLLRQFRPSVVELFGALGLLFQALLLVVVVSVHICKTCLRVLQLRQLVAKCPLQPLLL
mmetsp:Transcript_56449/g.123686  ORF Transcript_56449/g.123686 Transcript_56449/m.123686 type:complete len:254 (-) Transcript_56449:357-1118(-)